MKELIQSTGEVYQLLKGYTDRDGVVHTEFEIREMTGADEEAISKKEIKSNGAKILRTIVERCCTRIGTISRGDVKHSVWVEIIQSLSTGDQDLIMLKVREVSIGDTIESKYVCPNPECKTEIINEINTDELELKPFNGVDPIPFELPKGLRDKEGNILRKGTMRLPNGMDRELLDNVIKTNTGRANTLMLSRCILDLEGKGVYDELIRNLSVKDRDYLLKLIDSNSCGVNTQLDIECPNCYNEFKANLNAINFI